MAAPPLQLPTHEHPLFPIDRFCVLQCSGCHVSTSHTFGGYICNEVFCGCWFHKNCAEAPLEINHPSHPQHPLLLTKDSGDGPCDFCGQNLLPPFYSCPTCEFKVDLTCGIKPSPSSIEHPICHDHPLVFMKKREEEVLCELCKDSIGGPFFSCLNCNVYFHVDCVHLSKEVNHPCHSNHTLKLIPSESLTDNAEKTCVFCGGQPDNMLYHCSICNFTACLYCTKNPPPLVIEHIKSHKHPLTSFSRKIPFTCDACGQESSVRPYICVQCDFITHGGCIGLPRVININRHDHRISFTHHLGVGYSKCGVCRQSLSQYHGAYSCSVCQNYAVHTLCAILRDDVWDGLDLEGIPEHTEDIAPFKVVGDNLICHFSHEEHTLKLYKEGLPLDEYERCEACSHPVGFGSIYVCEEYCLVLHEKCANLPMKKRLVFGTKIFTLVVGCDLVHCYICGIVSEGFMYECQHFGVVDVHCGSISEPFVHDGHIHPLYFDKKNDHCCHGCHKDVHGHVLSCDECDYVLCFRCASFPEKINHRNDEHPLTLCCGEKAEGKYWCDICERELDPTEWFYTCSDCGVTLHAQCVLGDFSRITPGLSIDFGEKIVEVVLNNHNTGPLCSQCHSRCKVPVILKDSNEENGYICSKSCFSNYLGRNF